MDNIFSAYHYACKTKADREAIEELAPKVIEASEKASFGNIGDIKYTARTDVPNGGAWCDGATYTKAQYSVLYDMLVSGRLQYVDIATYNNVVELNGACGFFGLDTANQSFRVPTLTEVYIKAGQEAEEFGAESLPNITGESQWASPDSNESRYGVDGAFTKTDTTGQMGLTWSSESTAYYKEMFDASRSSSAYQDGAKVNPDHVTYRAYVILYTALDVKADITKQYQLNNPFSLLDYKFSEYELSNASWLLSNGAFHSGSVYSAVYSLLNKIYNGAEAKEGVSVKLATEEYSDTDFVLNTDDITFRLPIKVKLASGNAVVGNGMTLGFQSTASGTTYYYGLASDQPYNSKTYLTPQPDAYGKDEGSTFTDNTVSWDRTIGVTTDPAKSGIETSSQGLYLYFYVGETIQDVNIINAGGVLSSITKIQDDINDIGSKGLGYPTQEVIDQVWGTWVAPDNGFACAYCTSGTNDDHTYIFIYNTTTLMGSYGGAWNKGSAKFATISVSKGDVVIAGGSRLNGYKTFFVKGK